MTSGFASAETKEYNDGSTNVVNMADRRKPFSVTHVFWMYNFVRGDWENFAVCSDLQLGQALKEMAKNHPNSLIVRSDDKPKLSEFKFN